MRNPNKGNPLNNNIDNITGVFNFFFSLLLNKTLLILFKIAFGKTIASSMNPNKLNK